MPTRVIDVGPADGSSQPHLHPTGADVGQWATLSHCWGKTVTIQLTSDTFEERLRGIPMAEMPRNFRDAIVVTRILGIRYLWIDRLMHRSGFVRGLVTGISQNGRDLQKLLNLNCCNECARERGQVLVEPQRRGRLSSSNG